MLEEAVPAAYVAPRVYQPSVISPCRIIFFDGIKAALQIANVVGGPKTFIADDWIVIG